MRPVVAAFPSSQLPADLKVSQVGSICMPTMCNVQMSRSGATDKQTPDLHEIDNARCRRTKGKGNTCMHANIDVQADGGAPYACHRQRHRQLMCLRQQVS